MQSEPIIQLFHRNTRNPFDGTKQKLNETKKMKANRFDSVIDALVALLLESA